VYCRANLLLVLLMFKQGLLLLLLAELHWRPAPLLRLWLLLWQWMLMQVLGLVLASLHWQPICHVSLIISSNRLGRSHMNWINTCSS
jgi:hypothetical protein